MTAALQRRRQFLRGFDAGARIPPTSAWVDDPDYIAGYNAARAAQDAALGAFCDREGLPRPLALGLAELDR